PDMIIEEGSAAAWWKHREHAVQPIEKPFSIQKEAGKVILVVLNPTSLWAEVARLACEIDFNHGVVIQIAGSAPNDIKSGTRLQPAKLFQIAESCWKFRAKESSWSVCKSTLDQSRQEDRGIVAHSTHLDPRRVQPNPSVRCMFQRRAGGARFGF